MREIKFRGKDILNKNWYYGSLAKDNSQKAYYIIDNEKGIGRDIVEDSIGQYTGLKDKNGVEIYEGDILKAYFNKKDAYSINILNLKRSVNKIGKIEYIVDGFCIFIPKFGEKIYPLSFFGDEIIKQIEVIGNIYDNPELIENT